MLMSACDIQILTLHSKVDIYQYTMASLLGDITPNIQHLRFLFTHLWSQTGLCHHPALDPSQYAIKGRCGSLIIHAPDIYVHYVKHSRSM